MNEVCSWCGKAPHAGGCVTKSTMPPPPSAEELQRRVDYLQSDDFHERVKASLSAVQPATIVTVGVPLDLVQRTIAALEEHGISFPRERSALAAEWRERLPKCSAIFGDNKP